MKKKFGLIVAILLVGVPALAQFFALTLPTEIEVMEWAVYAADREAEISYSDGEGYKWMSIHSRGVTYRVYLTLSEGQWAADNDLWIVMMDAITDGYIVNDPELMLTLTPTAVPTEEVVAPETYQDICNYPQGLIIENGMTVISSRREYLGFTYFFFWQNDHYVVDIRENDEYVETKSLNTAIFGVPFSFTQSGETYMVFPIGC